MVIAPSLSVRNIRHPCFLYLFKTDGCGNLKRFFHPDDIMAKSGLTRFKNLAVLEDLLPW